MNRSAQKYRKTLKKHLKCTSAAKNRILKKFDTSLNQYMEENPSSDQDSLVPAFGPPEEMAKILMEEVSAGEIKQYRIKKRILTTVGYFFLILLILFTIYIYFIKQKPITEIDGAVDYGTLPSTTYVNE